MKATILFICVFSFQASAKSYAQKITLQGKAITLEQAFLSIQKQSGYSFIWDKQLVSSVRTISVNIKNASVTDALNGCLKGLPFTYKVKGDFVYIEPKPKNTPAVSAGVVNEAEAVQQAITGRVTDSAGTGLGGVSVIIAGTKKGTLTDNNGRYSIAAQIGDVLEFSFIGYQSQNITVKSSREENVVLQPDTKSAANDVVITAFGVSSSKRAVPYAVSTVNNEQLTNAGSDNLATSLQGKVPGAIFSSTAGGPMAGNRINIRGINSLDVNSRPLIVVNGIPIFDNDDSYSSRGFGNSEQGSGLNDINPDDIATITVLKGANAASLYGSQAMNGAILITTKSGSNQKGIGVDYSMNYTLNQIYGLPKFQDEYGGGNSADQFDDSVTLANGTTMPFYSPSITQGSFGPKFEGQQVMWWDGQVRPWVAQPDNLRQFFSNGSTTTNTVAVSGSDEKGSFRLSATNYSYKGFLPNMKEIRNSILFTGTERISKFITADVYANYIDNFRQNPPERIDRANYSLNTNDIASVLKENTINPATGYYLTDSALKYLGGGVEDAYIMQPLVWDQVKDRNLDHRGSFIGTGTVTVNVLKQLSIRLRGGTDRLFDTHELEQPFMAYAAPTNLSLAEGGYSKSNTNNYKNHGDVLVTYNDKYGKNYSLNVFAGYSMDDEYDEYNSISSANGLLYNNIYSTNNYKPAIVSGSYTRPGYNASASQGGERLDALFGSATLGYRDWLYLTVTDRNDWSSYLPPATNHYNYPSIGAGFVFSDALKLPSFINYGKLRASYGVTGVPGSRYFANNVYYYGSSAPNGGTYNGAVLSGFSNTVPPTNLIAEKNRSWEFGLESGLWQNRLKMDITYYINRSDNMINSVPIAPSTGATAMNINAGSLQNNGLEVSLIGDVIRNKNLTWEMTLNGTNISRKVISLPAGLTQRVLGNPFSANLMAIPGKEPYDIYMYPLATNDKGQVIVDNNGLPTFSSTLADMGNPLPKIYGGYINSVTYKRFTLTALLEYQFGSKVISYDNQFWNALGLSKESLPGRDASHGGVAYYIQDGQYVALPSGSSAPGGATVYHDGIIYPGVTSSGAANTQIIPAIDYYEDRYYTFGTQDAVYKNDYIRLREVSIAYSFPASLTHKLKIQGLSVSLIARNLWFLYKTVPNESPDETLGTDNINSAVLYSSYPLTRDLGVSLKVNL